MNLSARLDKLERTDGAGRMIVSGGARARTTLRPVRAGAQNIQTSRRLVRRIPT